MIILHMIFVGRDSIEWFGFSCVSCPYSIEQAKDFKTDYRYKGLGQSQ